MYKKKNALFILHYPPPIGGSAMMGSYIKGSPIINNSFNCTYINLSTSTTIEGIGKHSLKKYTKLFGICISVIRSLLRKRYDLVYVTPAVRMPAFYKDFFIILILKLIRVKTLYHLHSKGASESSNNQINKFIYKYAFKNTKVILLSKLLYPDIADYVKFEDVYLCPNGIPMNDVAKQLPARPVGSNTGCKLLFLSNMIFEKGIFVLLDACKILKDKNIRFECHFVGHYAEISETEFADKIAAMDLTKHVYAYGKKYGKEKYPYFINADIFIFPTYFENETFGLVNLEAMQFRLPVISTLVGGIPDVVVNNETGLLIPVKDPNALAEKIEFLIKNPDIRKKMGDAGRERFERLFSLEIFEKKINDILIDYSG